MKTLTKNIIILLLAGGFFIAMPAFSADANTPIRIRQNVDIDLFENNIGWAMQSSYLTGVGLTIETIQNYGIIEKTICLPGGSINIGEFARAIRALDPAPFPDSNDGGVVYIYSALAAKYPC